MSSLSITLFGTFQATLEERPITFCHGQMPRFVGLPGGGSQVDPTGGKPWPLYFGPSNRRKPRGPICARRCTACARRSAIPAIPTLIYWFHPTISSSIRPAIIGSTSPTLSAAWKPSGTHCGHGLPLCANCHEALKTAAALYGGEFMAGFSLAGSSTFELWLLARQGGIPPPGPGSSGPAGWFLRRDG